ncbi:MAG: DNA primase [Flavobacteria bacterium RIFCSPLOWO2_12_FULL_35_11]|nr:MAG: DNA primase [Flavobacteria bacterium RIFCSPLOWO2_12_FULL_35_11]
MKRIIVDYKKLTSEILNLLVEKFPDGYGIRDIIRFTNHKGHYVEAVEVATEDTIYLVKISDELVDSMENFYEEEEEEDIIERDLEIDLDLNLKVPIDEGGDLDNDDNDDLDNDENFDLDNDDEDNDDYNDEDIDDEDDK